MTERRSGNRLAVLDGLRLLVALMVVFDHYVALVRPWGHSTDTIFPTTHTLAQLPVPGDLLAALTTPKGSWHSELEQLRRPSTRTTVNRARALQWVTVARRGRADAAVAGTKAVRKS